MECGGDSSLNSGNHVGLHRVKYCEGEGGLGWERWAVECWKHVRSVWCKCLWSCVTPRELHRSPRSFTSGPHMTCPCPLCPRSAGSSTTNIPAEISNRQSEIHPQQLSCINNRLQDVNNTCERSSRSPSGVSMNSTQTHTEGVDPQ